MATTLSTAARNAAADAVVDLIDAGTGAADLVIQDGSTDLVTCAFSATAFGAAVNGVATANAISDGTASSSGTADSFEIRDGDGTVIISGTVGVSNADLTITNTSINTSDVVEVSSATYTVPAS